ncbi:deleted in malignant brain tumors 1 protein-like isoform X2 [Chiloscyllium plagiosum]|uniref:deleted in malignant brain tumors 1 protein-like isoform X2 n=1 Tax=Chiloscyllium plagiosum TaxID=36176 RepID=UPI001CB84529|nr:deleted in malignant brain tumors 1 protein-like isoform X2 [Chiloscyllium plagiosum]XP_043568148.1 deleted in malignant brain tumors 1 protein-like isoform X2 [Chiloscyllium plagiosum]XP_043568149.1 deleted in malignant brain tumors 1 protein-like isoform X2 [Chiloscyllium plagiosum]XP_043568150.1 deleted in malignant brain tumors 1 protein-like isoform X2 [Chiloscyllium plagiosum]
MLNFTDINVITAMNCKLDYIEIYDGPSINDALLGRTCRKADAIFTSSFNRMTVHFQSAFSIARRGFAAYYISMPAGVECGGLLMAENGSFSSPSYPLQYENNVECIWLIHVHNNQRIRLDFSEIRLEDSSGCKTDYIMIFDGPSKSSPLIAKRCSGSELSFISSSNNVTIYFKADHFGTDYGFTANYYSLPM